MEEMEISSWLTLDAIRKAAKTIETVGNLQGGHSMSVFCIIEDDFLELCYSDSTANTLRRYEDRDEFTDALEERKEEVGDAPYEEDPDLQDDFDDDDKEPEEDLDVEETDDDF
ncbi:MAG: hypothetical protein SCM96_07535 [Acidobacteriota bacterium]|nr:hypothetical protein [Acidobacteriota bacterium]